MDLVQLRWQQIRQCEANVLLERENVELRSQIVAMRLGQEDLVGRNKRALGEFARTILAWLKRSKGDMASMKAEFAQEMSVAGKINSSAKQLMEQLADQGISFSAHVRNAQTDKVLLMAEVEDLRQQLHTLGQSKTNEGDRLRALLAKSREELGEADHIKTQLAAKVDELQAGKVIDQNKHDVLHVECKRLKAWISKMEAEGLQTVADAREAEQRLLADHEHVLQGCIDEMNALRGTIALQEVQIERLTAALMGNKSHFAKFVELKTENMTLQNKLETVLNKANPNASKMAQFCLAPPAAEKNLNPKGRLLAKKAGVGGGTTGANKYDPTLSPEPSLQHQQQQQQQQQPHHPETEVASNAGGFLQGVPMAIVSKRKGKSKRGNGSGDENSIGGETTSVLTNATGISSRAQQMQLFGEVGGLARDGNFNADSVVITDGISTKPSHFGTQSSAPTHASASLGTSAGVGVGGSQLRISGSSKQEGSKHTAVLAGKLAAMSALPDSPPQQVHHVVPTRSQFEVDVTDMLTPRGTTPFVVDPSSGGNIIGSIAQPAASKANREALKIKAYV